MKTRILVGIPIGLLMIAALALQSWVLIGLILLLSIAGQYEILKVLESKGSPVIKSVPFIFAAASLPVLLFIRPEMLGLEILLVLFVICLMALFVIAMFRSQYNFESLLKSVLAMIYPQFFLIFAYLITIRFTNMQFVGTNPVVLVMAVIPPVFCDIFAYFFGRAFGKKKLCPLISPKKTVAGSIAGLLGGLIAALLVWMFMASGLFIHGFVWNMDVINFLILGVAVAGVSQFGDLSASFIKRHFEIKDYGKILPGHGGILDRVDSILFSLPIVYLYFIVYNSYAAAIR